MQEISTDYDAQDHELEQAMNTRSHRFNRLISCLTIVSVGLTATIASAQDVTHDEPSDIQQAVKQYSQDTLKPMLDVSGEPVAWVSEKMLRAKTTNKYTGELADGSDIAKRIRPGILRVIDAPFAAIIEHDNAGDQIPQGEPGRLVANHNVFTADGLMLMAGEPIGAVSFISDGIIKNPGPEAVEVTVVANAEGDTFTLSPGDGIFIGEDPNIAAAGGIQYEPRCLCTCSDDEGHSRTLPVLCPGSDDDSMDLPGGQPTLDCGCDDLNGQPCAIVVADEFYRGTFSNCSFIYWPVPARE